MKFTIRNDYTITLFGIQLNSLQHMLIVFAYILFLMIPWPLLSGSYLFIPVGICLFPAILPDLIYYNVYRGKQFYNLLLYPGLFISTFMYTYFFLDNSFFLDVLHYVVYLTFGYVYSKKP